MRILLFIYHCKNGLYRLRPRKLVKTRGAFSNSARDAKLPGDAAYRTSHTSSLVECGSYKRRGRRGFHLLTARPFAARPCLDIPFAPQFLATDSSRLGPWLSS